MTIRLVIADDHRLVRDGLREYLERTDDFEVVGEAADGRELLTIVEESPEALDIALIDATMPRVNGLDAARTIRDRHPGVGVVMLIASDEGTLAADAVDAGARGWVYKTADGDELVRMLRLAADRS